MDVFRYMIKAKGSNLVVNCSLFGRMGVALLVLLLWVTFAACSGQNVMDSAIQYSIFEEQPVNTSVGNIVQDANLGLKYDSTQLQTMYFSFLEHPAKMHDFFTIDTSGEILTSVKIDRENICPLQESCYILLDIQVQPLQYFQIIKISVLVNDLNDNKPTFPDTQVFLFLPESSVPGTTLAIPLAVDNDSPKYSIQEYTLISNSTAFDLVGFTNSIEAEDLTIGLKESLDREIVAFYTFVIVSVDGGSPGNTGSVLVNITVSDVNDNPPVFERQNYFVNIPENVGAGYVLTRVQAIDEDHGLNGEVLYEFSRRTRELFGDLFSINDRSGEITITGTLNYEKASSFLLSVIARDQSTSSLTAMATVNIQVQDLNDNAPNIRVNILTGNDSFVSVPEVLNDPRAVVHLSVRDPDEGSNGQFACTLNNFNFRLSQLYPTEFMIEAVGNFDREENGVFNLEIMCEDKGEPVQSSLARVKVRVTDTNDSPPLFSKPIYLVSVMENNAIGELVVQVSASDEDSGENARVTYKIPAGGNEFFDIDQDSGRLTTKLSLDREENFEVNTTIVAVDHGEPQLTGTTVVVVSVLDEDDSLPTFVTNYDFEILENEPSDVLVGQLKAVDDDLPENHNPVNYSIVSDAKIPFRIESTSGVVYTTETLDREHLSFYSFEVLAESNRSVSRATATVHIKDLNDNVPVIIFPNRLNQTVFLSPKAEPGHIVTRVVAGDGDEGNNAELFYTLQTPADEDLFTIDGTSGVIYLNREMGEMKESLIEVIIRVTDGGSPSLSGEAHLKIAINGSGTQAWRSRDPSDDGDNNLVIVIAVATTCSLVAIVTLIILALIIKRYCRKSPKTKNNRKVFSWPWRHNLGFTMEKSRNNTAGPATEDMADNKPPLPTYEDWSKGFKKAGNQMSNQATVRILGPGDSYPSKTATGFGHLDKDSDSGCSADLSNGSTGMDCGQGPTQRPEQKTEARKERVSSIRVTAYGLQQGDSPEDYTHSDKNKPSDNWRTDSYVRSMQSPSSSVSARRSLSYSQAEKALSLQPHITEKVTKQVAKQVAKEQYSNSKRSSFPGENLPGHHGKTDSNPYYMNLDEVQIRKELFRSVSETRPTISLQLEHWRQRKYSHSFHEGKTKTNYIIPGENQYYNIYPESDSTHQTNKHVQRTNSIPTETFYQQNNYNCDNLYNSEQQLRTYPILSDVPAKTQPQKSKSPKKIIHEIHV